jgi:hypothetical protein
MSYPVSMKIFTLLVVLLAATASYAQIGTSQRIHTIVATHPPVNTQVTMHLESRHNMRVNHAAGAELPFTIVVDSLQSNVNDGKQHAYLGTITNRTDDTLQVFFRRQQDVPCGWTSSVCFGSLCFPATQDNAVTLLAPGQSLALTLDINPALSEHPDTSHVYITLGAGDMAASSDTMLYHFVTTFEPSNPPIIFGWASLPKDVYSFNGGGLHLFSAILQHRACSTLPYHFSMQAQLPAGWTASYTVGKSETSTGALTYSFAGAGDLQGADRQKIQFKVTAPTLAKTDSAVIYLSVHPETSNPADSMLYKFTAVFVGYQVVPPPLYVDTGKTEHTVAAIINSFATDTTQYEFLLDRPLPPSWNVSFCIGDSCSQSNKLNYQFPPKSSKSILVTIQTPVLTGADSSALSFLVRPTNNPSDSTRINFQVLFLPESSGVVLGNPEDRAGLAVLNVWPNPVHASANLNFDIMTDRDGPAIAHVYDVVGSEVYTSTMDGLSVGENHVQLGGLNLPSGDYMIVIQQGKATSEAIRINYVK